MNNEERYVDLVYREERDLDHTIVKTNAPDKVIKYAIEHMNEEDEEGTEENPEGLEGFEFIEWYVTSKGYTFEECIIDRKFWW